MGSGTETKKAETYRVLWLTVVEVRRAGAVLDGSDAEPPIDAGITAGDAGHIWLPFKSQTAPVTAGQRVLCAVFPGRDGRPVATMNVYEYLEDRSPYQEGDRVSGTVYETSRNFGAFVAVDDRYQGLIPLRECYGDIRIGEPVKDATVISVRDDGRLNLRIREKAYIQMDKDADLILERIRENGGSLPFNDKADPEIIRANFNMSKNEFKRAVGRLLKQGSIDLTEKGIVLK